MEKDFVANIYREHVQSIYRYCLFRTNSYQDAEDVTAEVFIKFIENYQRVQQDCILPWLFTVAGNLCINHTRKMAKIRLLEKQPEVSQEHHQPPWEDERVWEALKGLDLKQLQVIYLKIIEDMSFKEIAQFLGKREGAVKMSFYRGIKTLRKILEEEDVYVLPFKKARSGKASSSI